MKRAILGLIITVLLGTGVILGKGPANKIILTTPDGRTIEITDRAMLEVLSMTTLELFPVSIPQPEGVTGEGYELERQYKDGNTHRTFDRVRYYPAGYTGYVFYVGIENGWSEYDGKWFSANPAAVYVMNTLIAGETVVKANDISPLLTEWRLWFAQLERDLINWTQD